MRVQASMLNINYTENVLGDCNGSQKEFRNGIQLLKICRLVSSVLQKRHFTLHQNAHCIVSVGSTILYKTSCKVHTDTATYL